MEGTHLDGQAAAALPVKERKGISGSTVKIIAAVTMLIDHIGAVVLARFLTAGMNAAGSGGLSPEQYQACYSLYFAMRMIGRLGFPIFCFLLVEGYQRTRNVKQYALRLFLFSLISDVPFDLAICGQPVNWGYQNVYFTLLFGLLALWACDFFEKREQSPDRDLPAVVRSLFLVTGALAPMAYLFLGKKIKEGQDPLVYCAVSLGVVLTIFLLYGWRRGLRPLQTVAGQMTALVLCMLAAEVLRTDYAGMGVLTIAVMYLLRRHRVLAMAAGCVVLTILSLTEVPAFLAMLFVALYNGKRGLKMKYFFYGFYPGHLLLLYLVAVLMGLGSVALL